MICPVMDLFGSTMFQGKQSVEKLDFSHFLTSSVGKNKCHCFSQRFMMVAVSQSWISWGSVKVIHFVSSQLQCLTFIILCLRSSQSNFSLSPHILVKGVSSAPIHQISLLLQIGNMMCTVSFCAPLMIWYSFVIDRQTDWLTDGKIDRERWMDGCGPKLTFHNCLLTMLRKGLWSGNILSFISLKCLVGLKTAALEQPSRKDQLIPAHGFHLNTKRSTCCDILSVC